MKIDYSIVIPVYNEEAILEKTICQLQQAMQSEKLNGEIIVCDNNSSDRSAEVATNAGARVVFEPINQISRARNTGAQAANGRYLVFVDADTEVPPALLQTALRNLESGNCCGGGAKLAVANDSPLPVRTVLGFWNLLSKGLRLAAGCFVYCRKDDFAAVGGFSEKYYATEEIWFVRALKRHARRFKRKFIVISEPKVITSDRKLNWFSHGYHLYLLLLLGLFPFLMRYKWACSYWYKRPQTKSQEPNRINTDLSAS